MKKNSPLVIKYSTTKASKKRILEHLNNGEFLVVYWKNGNISIYFLHNGEFCGISKRFLSFNDNTMPYGLHRIYFPIESFLDKHLFEDVKTIGQVVILKSLSSIKGFKQAVEIEEYLSKLEMSSV